MPYISNEDLVQKPQNVDTVFRESFETYDTANTWSQTQGSGDLIVLDGNAVSASYLVISKDPLTANTQSSITTQATFDGAMEIVAGLHLSQRVLGQEFSIEYVSTDTPLTPVADTAISSIVQATTTLTVTTSSAHNLTAGTRIGIYGITSDSRFNYPSLVVATVTSPTVFTATAGPGGTIGSLSVGPYTNQGFVYMRPSMDYAQDGTSQIFENTSATNSSLYIRSDSGDVYPSGTLNGNHSVTTATTASTQPFVSPYTYNFIPTNEYRTRIQADRVDFYDGGIDSPSQLSQRLSRTQVVPNLTKTFKLRFRAVNDKGLSVPTAKIVSAVKSASTTATITTAAAHGLTTGDYVGIYGIRDQTNFANQVNPTVVASVINSTQFTVSFGASATATSYGGMVMRVNGGNTPTGVSTNHVIQTATVSAAGELTLTSSANWVPLIGDYVNVYGCRNNTDGGDMGVDGVYKVVNVATTTLTLIPIGSTVLPAAFGSTNCGGTVIKRTDFRISYVRMFEYLRQRIEAINSSGSGLGLPVTPNGGTVSTVSTVSTASLAISTLVNDVTSATLSSTTTTSAITPASGTLSQEFNVIVTAVSGSPTLDFVVQESDDSGTNWFDIYHFPRITATGQYRSPLIPLIGNRIRYVQTVAGTTSFTRSVNRLQNHNSQPLQRQFIDRALTVNTIDSVTSGTFFIDGCATLNLFVSMGAVTTTAPVLILEVSYDNATWVQAGTDVTTAANTNNLLSVANIMGRFVRVKVKTAGVGATLNYLLIKGMGY